jgi:hypothetical protein
MNSIFSFQFDGGNVNLLERIRSIFIFLLCVCTQLLNNNILTLFPNKILVVGLYLFNLWVISAHPFSVFLGLSCEEGWRVQTVKSQKCFFLPCNYALFHLYEIKELP